MDIEKLITDTLTSHEHVVPDGDEVFAAARDRIERRRSVLTRPLAVAAGVAVLTLAAVAVVALNRPADEAPVAAQPTSPVSTSPAGPAVAELTMPFSLGWLPPGDVEYLARRINLGGSAENPDVPLYGGEYMLTVTVGGQVLNFDVQHMRGRPVDSATFKSGPGNSVTINGQRGVESAKSDGPGGYELYVAHPEAGSMYVHVGVEYGSTASAQQLVDVGRRVAENIRIPGTTTVTPSFGLRDLPSGMRICTFDVEKPFDPSPLGSHSSTGYQLGLGTCDTMPALLVSVTNANGPTGPSGEPVQGHATRYTDENDYHKMWVLDAVGDAPILVAGRVPLTDLYDLANRLVLPS